ncbi:MAG: NAD-dependent protein deacylase [Gammaproteobacteria bacterium]
MPNSIPSSEQQGDFARAVRALRAAHRIAVLTGAGMSVASGLPTYRGIGGLYNDMVIDEGLPIEEILHAYTFARNPALTWKYIAQIEQACRGAEPNEGHRLLARWDERFDLWVATQNVDGFHRAAGSRQLIELHGNLGELFCIDCECRFVLDDFDFAILPPRCRHCDGLVRPNVVLFGELLPMAQMAAYEKEFERGFDVVLAIGTSAGFPYISEPIMTARARGATTIEINPEQTALSASASIHLAMDAVDALRRLDLALASA